MKLRLPERISFHDSGILAVTRGPDSVTLDLENVTFEDGQREASVTLGGIRTISCDGSDVDSIEPIYEDGEIWTLAYTADVVEMIIDWTDFKLHRSQTHAYVIVCEPLTAVIK